MRFINALMHHGGNESKSEINRKNSLGSSVVGLSSIEYTTLVSHPYTPIL